MGSHQKFGGGELLCDEYSAVFEKPNDGSCPWCGDDVDL